MRFLQCFLQVKNAVSKSIANNQTMLKAVREREEGIESQKEGLPVVVMPLCPVSMRWSSW